jgi:hypothetical protein
MGNADSWSVAGACALAIGVLSAGQGCDGRALGAGPRDVDPLPPAGLHASFDGVSTLPDATLLARLSQRGLVDLSFAELNGMSDTERAALGQLTRCALEPTVTLDFPMGAGVGYSFEGALGLAPEIATGACGTDCQELLTACYLAHVNTVSTSVPIWITSAAPAMGRERSTAYPLEEATFFGNFWAPAATAAYCKAPTASAVSVAGRIEDRYAWKYYGDADQTKAGTCAACARSPSGDLEACALDGVAFTHPVTVWRSRPYQAEAAVLSGSAQRAGRLEDPLQTHVGYMRPGATVTFEGVLAANAGSNRLAIYFMNGDPVGGSTRKLSVAVNGGLARTESFPAKGGDWSRPLLRQATFDGFREGANTITFTVPADVEGPDLDWIEILPTP